MNKPDAAIDHLPKQISAAGFCLGTGILTQTGSAQAAIGILTIASQVVLNAVPARDRDALIEECIKAWRGAKIGGHQ